MRSFMDALAERGTVLLGGPLGDDGNSGDALLVVSANGEDAVRATLSPGAWHGTVLTIKAWNGGRCRNARPPRRKPSETTIIETMPCTAHRPSTGARLLLKALGGRAAVGSLDEAR
jgi:hypothetical protein